MLVEGLATILEPKKIHCPAHIECTALVCDVSIAGTHTPHFFADSFPCGNTARGEARLEA